MVVGATVVVVTTVVGGLVVVTTVVGGLVATTAVLLVVVGAVAVVGSAAFEHPPARAPIPTSTLTAIKMLRPDFDVGAS